MELIINRVKYHVEEEELDAEIFISKEDIGEFSMQLQFFLKKINNKGDIIKLKQWQQDNLIQDSDYIHYSFTKANETNCQISYNNSFKYHLIISELANGLISQEFCIEIKPLAYDLSAYQKIGDYSDKWDLFRRIDFKINTRFNEIVFNIGSASTLISKTSIPMQKEFNNAKFISNTDYIKRVNNEVTGNFRLIANYEIAKYFSLEKNKQPINYIERYRELSLLYNENLKNKSFGVLNFVSQSFLGVPVKKVRFEKNKMVFKNNGLDINPITGMKNYGVYNPAPNSYNKKIIFIYRNSDDANNLFKYLKGGFKQFPGLERYVGIPVVLADANNGGKPKRLQYSTKSSLITEYEDFEKEELPLDYYEDYFAIVIGDFDKNNSDTEYYELKAALLEKGIPSQFVKEENIRKTSVFNYHLPNIAIGIHAKLGGIPWRLDSQKKNDLIIGFNQVTIDEKKFIGSSVFFDNEGYLRKTNAYEDCNNINGLIAQLKESVSEYVSHNEGIERLVIHYYKTFSSKEKTKIDKLLTDEFNINIPYALVEVNDSKSRLELAFDPNFNFGMPISGTFLNLSKYEYLLFNNNRFSDKSGISLKDELPLKLKIHFADQSGFSHQELIEQVYEFSRLIWKGLKQRIQPATCYYAKEIANFYAHSPSGVPNNELTQNTPWFL